MRANKYDNKNNLNRRHKERSQRVPQHREFSSTQHTDLCDDSVQTSLTPGVISRVSIQLQHTGSERQAENQAGGKKEERVRRKASWSHTIQMSKSKWCKSDHLGSTYNAAGAAPGLLLLPKRPAKNCCTILERIKTESEAAHFKTNALFVLRDKSATSVTVKEFTLRH